MSNYVKLAAEAGDQYLSALSEGQEQFLKSVSTLSAWVPPATAAPAIPALSADLPTPREVFEANFAFAAKLLKQQKAFTEKLFAATSTAS
jgi:hypothetical protein